MGTKLSIEEKIQKRAEELKKLKAKAKADAKAAAEREKIENQKLIISAGEIVMQLRAKNYQLSMTEFRMQIEKLFNVSVATNSVSTAETDDEAE